MQPKDIRLSNDLREHLETVVKPIFEDRSHDDVTRDNRLAEAVQTALMEKACDNDAIGKECYQLLDAIICMQTGHGAPVIHLHNLPEHGLSFMYGLMKNLQADATKDLKKISVEGERTRHLRFHQERPYTHTLKKTLTAMHCVNQGASPKPTIFLTADEMIHALTCAQLSIDPELSPEAVGNISSEYASAYQHNVDRLKEINVHAADGEGIEHSYPLLYENTAQEKDAPRYFVTAPNVKNMDQSFASQEDRQAYTDFHRASELLYKKATRESFANVLPNTAVLWADHWVYHAPGEVRSDVEASKGLRILKNIEVTSSIGYAHNPHNLAVDGPACDMPDTKIALPAELQEKAIQTSRGYMFDIRDGLAWLKAQSGKAR